LIKLKKIKLLNYCGYKNFELNLFDDDIQKWILLFGPNGVGKSNFLDAVQLLSRPWRLKSRQDSTIFLRKLTFHPDYNPNYEGYDKSKTELYMEGIFSTDEGDKKVVFKNNWIPEESGVIVNELPEGAFSACFYVDADNPINMQKFQIRAEFKKEFIDFAESIYGFKCELPENRYTEDFDRQTGKYVSFYTDLVINKYNNTKVHFKRFSAGEKKIATLLSTLFNFIYKKEKYGNDILLIDNIAMHIYWSRHLKIIEKINEYFSNEQIIATTHSPILIKQLDKKYLFDLEKLVEDVN